MDYNTTKISMKVHGHVYIDTNIQKELNGFVDKKDHREFRIYDSNVSKVSNYIYTMRNLRIKMFCVKQLIMSTNQMANIGMNQTYYEDECGGFYKAILGVKFTGSKKDG